VGLLGDRFDVLDERATKQDVGARNEGGLLVDRIQQFLQVDRNAVFRLYGDETGAFLGQALVVVDVRGEIETFGDDFVAAGPPVEA
jgi:hypothetical protein